MKVTLTKRGLHPVVIVEELATHGYKESKPPVSTKTKATFFLRRARLEDTPNESR